MFSVLKKFTKNGDDRSSAPTPMSSSLQRKFSRGVHFNMKILIKGDRNVGKSCLLQRLQGGPFVEEYVPTEQIQVAPVHWTYKNTDFIVKVEVWEVVDKGRAKKKPPLGLKLENQSAPVSATEDYETPVLDATFLDVYKNASGVILMLDITKPWTFEYVVKELALVPADLPVVVLGNHCDMQHHRHVHIHHIDEALYNARKTRTAPIRYAESSMRNGFGLRLLHKFLSIPFLKLQKTSLLEQLQRNQKDMEEIEKELNDFQMSDESHYETFVRRLASKKQQSVGPPELRTSTGRSPSIVLGAGKPIIPPNVNPLLAQSILQSDVEMPPSSDVPQPQTEQTQYVSPELTKMRRTVSTDMAPAKMSHQNSEETTPTGSNATTNALDEFYAGTLDSSFLEDFSPITISNQDNTTNRSESESENEGDKKNPMVTVDEDDLDVFEYQVSQRDVKDEDSSIIKSENDMNYAQEQLSHLSLITDSGRTGITDNNPVIAPTQNTQTISSPISVTACDVQMLEHAFPEWARDSSARRSPEGDEDPDNIKETVVKAEKKYKKKKSKHKDKGDEKDDGKEKKHKHKKKSDRKSDLQNSLLVSVTNTDFKYEEYESF